MSCLVRNRKRNSGSTLDEFDKVSTLANADGTECVSPDPDRNRERVREPDINEPEPEFGHLSETRRKIHDAIAAMNDDSFDKRMARLLMQYECAIREEFERAQYLPEKCRKLSRILIGLTNVIHTMVQGRTLQQDEGYRQRMCNIVGFYISCELCSAQEPVESEEIIINRINSCLKLYVEYGEGGAGVHREHVLRSLLAAPKLFNRASILSMLYSRLFPHWSMPNIMIQAELPDKLYIEYILIFYYWQRLESDESVKERIVEFAEKFMRPSRSLALKSVYAHYLPKFTDPITATRTILNHLRISSCTSLHVVSKVDNRPQQSNEVVLSSDDEDSCPMWDISGTPPSVLNNHPPVFLQNLCQNARQLEPCKRANALFSGIDNSIEIVELRDSDDDVEMFSVNFNVPANVDGIISNSNSNDSANQTTTTILGEDDSVPVTRIYPSNLRTYERALPPPATYTVPRIVNSYSCRRDSLHLVSTTAPHLVDQCVQTFEDEEQDLIEGDQYPSAHSQGFFPRSSSASVASGQLTPIIHCRQTSSQNSNCSDSSLLKKQVTFCPRHLGATASNFKASLSKKPAIKQYITKSPANGLGSQLWKAEHQKASAKMFAKLDAKIKARNEAINVAASQLTPTTSNASSGTPTKISATPNRNRATPRGQRVGLPTPPASTHSSSSPCQNQSATTDNHSDWGFSRRFFAKAAGDEVSYYNQLLTQQRENIRRRRLNNKKKKTVKAKKPVQKELDHQNLIKQATKRRRELRYLNAQKRNEIENLEQNLSTIRKSAPRNLPIIRLKRFNLKKTDETPKSKSKENIERADIKQKLQEKPTPEKKKKKTRKKKPRKERQKQPENIVQMEEVKTLVSSRIVNDETEPVKESHRLQEQSKHEQEHDIEHQQFLEEQLLQEQYQLEMDQQKQGEVQQVEEEAQLLEDEPKANVEDESQSKDQPPEVENPQEVESQMLAERETNHPEDTLSEEEEPPHDDDRELEEEQLQKNEERRQSEIHPQIENEIEPALSRQKPKRRRRVKRTPWTHTKNKLKKQRLLADSMEFEADSGLETASIQPEPAPDEDPAASEESSSVIEPAPVEEQTSVDEPTAVEESTAIEESTPVGKPTKPVSAADPEPAFEFDQDMVPEVGNELEIAAPIRSPENEDSNSMLSPSHNLELVTSHVPVYLLNGESRDVSTPLSTSSFSGSGSEPYATSKD
ncbi:uncharacterized protein LOC108096431 [Drosophila ficusphila]|uniref:uncharacterized protein LOC108096431 n=1 Tax=Drosophila ficusphila TaxID=30025 RepID=UPI0007E85859|nr:uncharacterized protein LOC108096431 [Drosophila ficusphila]